MADETIEVETVVTVDDAAADTGDSGSDAVTESATDHVIDAAIESGTAAAAASADAADAGASAFTAEMDARTATDAAQAAQHAAAQTARTLELLETLTQQNAALLAAQQAAVSTEIAAGLPDVDVDPEVDIAPENSHWLTRKWGSGLFGKKADR